jgi:hypothetical protein
VRDPESNDVPWPEESSDPGTLEIRGRQLRSHWGNFINVGTYMQVPTIYQNERRLLRAGADIYEERPVPVTSDSIRTMSPSMARMSASISSSGRGGV